FLTLTGYEQVRSVVAALVGDWESARKVDLVLPETGVCSTDSDSAGGCASSSTVISPPALVREAGLLVSASSKTGLLAGVAASTDVLPVIEESACCSLAAQTTCCETSTKESCCGTTG